MNKSDQQILVLFKILHNNVSLPVARIPVSPGRVSFDNLAALVQSETSPMSAFLAPVSPLWPVCHVTGAQEQTQTMGELSSGVRGVFTHLYSILCQFSIENHSSENCQMSSQLQTQGSSCRICRGDDEHLSIRVASAGVRCLEILRQFLLRGGWFIVTS